MSQSTVVSYPQVILVQQLSPENSEKAQDSQVTVIPSQGLKQVMTSLLLIQVSFATQLLLKEGVTIPKLESSKYWDNKMVCSMETLNL
jgi:hypothetical protein